MKYFIPAIFLLASCTPYKSFITVTPRTDIPDGSREFVVYAPLAAIKDSLKAQTIAYIPNEAGLNTEQILIDEGTKAEFRIYAVDSVSVRVVPYWGITEKVASQVRIWSGLDSNTEEMTRVIYKKSEGRPKIVFDYGVQVFGRCGRVVYK